MPAKGSVERPDGPVLPLFLFMLCVAAAVYGPAWRFPLIMDDWKWMHHIQSLSIRAFLVELLQPADAFFYRPLSGLWHFLEWHGFRGDATPYRVVSLLALAGCGLLV